MVEVKIDYKPNAGLQYEGDRWHGTDPNYNCARLSANGEGGLIWSGGKWLGIEWLPFIQRIEIGVA